MWLDSLYAVLAWMLGNILLIVIGGLITKLIELFLPGSIRYRLRLWWGRIVNYFRNPLIYTRNIWGIYLNKEYDFEHIQECILEYLNKNRIKAYFESDIIKFEIVYGSRKLNGEIHFAPSEIEDEKLLVNKIEIITETTIPYRDFFEELLSIREVLYRNIITYLLQHFNDSKLTSLLIVKINKLEEITKIIDDLKVRYISLGDVYRIYLADKFIRVVDIIDSNTLKALKTLMAFYL